MSGSSSQGSPGVFVTTRWSVVLAARDKDLAQSDGALEFLCRTYWFPLYGYARRRGYSPEDSQDLTQGFFARLLAKDWLSSVDPERGRFRSFLLVCFKRFLSNEWRHVCTEKRGGLKAVFSLDTTAAESRFASQCHAALPEDAAFDRQWALTLLDQALARIEAEYASAGKRGEFVALKGCLTAERGDIDYAGVAAAAAMNEGAARVAVHRLRKRFRQMFRELVTETVADTADVEDEIRHLAAALAT